MKNKLLITTLSLFLISCSNKNNESNNDWKDCPLSENITLTTISMVNENIGYVAGVPEAQIKTIVSFDTWPPDTLLLMPNKYVSLDYKIEVFSAYATLYKTTDGGNNWTAISTPFKSGFKDIQFITETDGFAITNYDGVYKTTDGGHNWDLIANNYIQWYRGHSTVLDKLYFIDNNNGFLLNKEGLVLRTSNGGASWDCISIFYLESSSGTITQHFNTIFDGEIMDVWFSNNSNAGYLYTQKKMYCSKDKGKTWSVIYESEQYDINLTVFVDAHTIYLPLKGIKTSNGGSSWENFKFEEFGEEIISLNDKEFYHFARYKNSLTKTNIGSSVDKQIMTLDRNDRIEEMVFSTENIGFIIGDNGMILKYHKNL